jgi:hypothetical protein
MSRAGLRTARGYDWRLVASQVLEYYQEILARRSLHPDRQSVRFARMRRMAGLLSNDM